MKTPRDVISSCWARILILMLAGAVSRGWAADVVFSGPQAGERATPFKVLDLGGEGKERDPVAEAGGGSLNLVFVHGVERSLVPLLRAIDAYGHLRSSLVRTEVVLLFTDRAEGEQRGRAVVGSLKLRSKVGLSLDGGEGPGNYGLNKQCLMTVLAVKDRVVTTNFALVQPGVADAARIIPALAASCGDKAPPPMDQLLPPQGMAGDGKGKDPFPGAVPEDGKLNGLLRQFIRATNDVATVDRLMEEVKQHIRGNMGLTLQASNGWVRVLHFGDRYGNEYSRKVGREFLGGLASPKK